MRCRATARAASWRRHPGRGHFVPKGRRCILARLEFEDAPLHLRHILVTDAPSDVLVDEPALTERGLLRADHVAHLGGDTDLFARSQIPVVGLLAVGGDHTDIPCAVEQLHHRAHGIVGRTLSTQAEHGPHLNHCRWGNNSRMPGSAGRGLVGVDRVAVPERLHPVVDRRLVHRIPSRARLGDNGSGDLCDFLLDTVRVGHRGTLGTLRPEAAIISRITSFTPPPKVMTRLRLVCESSQSSSSAVSRSAGLPYLPTISSASRPTY